MWNGAEMWAETLSSGILNVISASRDVEKDLAIVDHLFTDIFLASKLFLFT